VQGIVVTDQPVVVLERRRKESFALVAGCPRCAVEATEYRPDGVGALLTVELAGTPFPMDVSAFERGRAAAVVRALKRYAAPDEQLLASLSRVDLTRRSRRELGIGPHERAAVVVTDRHLVFLARRNGHTRVAMRCPRHAVRVRDHETVWPGGDLLFDRVVLESGDATVGFDLDGRHERAKAVVAALGGVSDGRNERECPSDGLDARRRRATSDDDTNRKARP
jgi:hypothetical protein